MGWVNGSSLHLSPAYGWVSEWELWDTGPGHQLMLSKWWLSIIISAAYIPAMLIVRRLLPQALPPPALTGSIGNPIKL